MYAGVVLGGLGSNFGAFWGGLLIGVVQQMSTLILPYQLQNTAIFVVFLAVRPVLGAETHLVLLGGGRAPAAALARFVRWSGGPRARILVLPWGAEDAREAVESAREMLRPFSPGAVEAGPAAPLRDDAPAELRRRLDRATGILLAGGDQQRLLDALADDVVAAGLRARYRAGAAVAGSSAGTAAISTLAITGEGDFTAIDANVAFVETPQDYREYETDTYLSACYDAYRYFFAVTIADFGSLLVAVSMPPANDWPNTSTNAYAVSNSVKLPSAPTLYMKL